MKKFHGISSVHNTGRSHSQITDSKKSPLSASTENNAAGCDSRHLARESCLIVSQPDSSQVFFGVSHCPRFACRYCHIGWTRIAASGHGKPKDAPQKTSSFHSGGSALDCVPPSKQERCKTHSAWWFTFDISKNIARAKHCGGSSNPLMHVCPNKSPCCLVLSPRNPSLWRRARAQRCS